MVQNNNLQTQSSLITREKISQQVDNRHCFREAQKLFNVVLTLLKNFFLAMASAKRLFITFKQSL